MKIKLKRKNTGNVRIFVDMDGVSAKWMEGSDYTVKGYYRHLPAEEEIVRAIRILVEHGYDVYILSSAISKEAEEDKVAWIKEHMPEIYGEKVVFVPYGKEKTDYVPRGVKNTDLLLDDHTPNLQDWASAGGTPVKVYNSCNGRGGTVHKHYVTTTMPSELIAKIIFDIIKRG